MEEKYYKDTKIKRFETGSKILTLFGPIYYYTKHFFYLRINA